MIIPNTVQNIKNLASKMHDSYEFPPAIRQNMTSNRANLYFILAALPVGYIVGGFFKKMKIFVFEQTVREYRRPIPYSIRYRPTVSAVVR